MDGVMSELFSAFESIIRRHDGTVEKYIGDAMVAVFGVPSIHEDDPVRAVNAAFDFLETLKERNESLAERNLHIGFRIGINTGLITTGKRGQFDVVTGHAMAVAARLESQAPLDSIFVSESTKEKCEKDFIFSEPYEVYVKGRAKPVRAYLVRNRNPNPFEHDSHFVGREDLLDTITRGYLKHNASATSGFLLTGDAGVGKSRLASQFIERVRRFPDFESTCLYARALRFRRAHFAVVTDLLVNYFELEPSADRETVVQRVRSRLDLDEKAVQDFASLLSGRHGQTVDNRAFVLLYLVLKQILSKHAESPYPVLVFIDNVRYMDSQSREFFQFFLKNADIKPFFLLADREPDEELVELFRGLGVIEVSPLNREDSRALLERLWPDLEDEGLVQTILSNSAGNPLFIKEYARFVRDNRDATALPTTIQNIFLTSVDSYPHAMRELLKKLSAFVHSFSFEDAKYIQEKTDADPGVVDTALPEFMREGILIQEQDIYMFKHDVFKKALYNSLLNHNKKILHRLIATRMQMSKQPHILRLLHHLSRAEEYSELRRVLLNAANVHTQMDYIYYFDLLLDRTDPADSDNVTEYLFYKSAILFNNGASEDAYALVKRILEISLEQKEPKYAAQAYHLLTGYNMHSYAFDKAFLTGKKALYYYGQHGDTARMRQNVLKIMSNSELLRNNPSESARLLHEMRALSDEESAEILSARVERHLIIGEYRAAGEVFRSIEGTNMPQDPTWGLRFFRLFWLWSACRFTELREAVGELRRTEWARNATFCQMHSWAATAYYFSGETDAMSDHLQQAEFYVFHIKNDFDRIDAIRTLAEAQLIVENEEKAEELAKQGLAIGLRHSSYFPTFTLLMLLVEILSNRGDTREAEFLLDEAGFYVEAGPMLRRRDLMLYYYYRGTLGDHDAEALSTAAEYLEEERREIDSEEHFAAFLKLRSYHKVAQKLAVGV
jgi:hypothetical protein